MRDIALVSENVVGYKDSIRGIIASAKMKSDNHNEAFGCVITELCDQFNTITVASEAVGIQPFGDQPPSSKNSLLQRSE